MAKKLKTLLKEMTRDELQRKLEELHSALFKYRMQAHTAPLKNPMVIRHARREVAQVMTQLNRQKTGGSNG